MDQNPQNRRPHSYRGRRGPDRRGPDRRPSPMQQQPPPQERAGRPTTDVEQIMRDLRARIAQRHGIDLSQQQIQELAARRLEAILDPRTVKPALLSELRRSAKTEAEAPVPAETAGYDFTETTIYESHRGFIRFLRRLLNPLLMLFVNPNPIARALSAQTKINTEAAARAAEQERRLTEWNALLYDIVQRLVTEVARSSIEVQALTSRVESLSARVEFNDKRVRSLETVPPTTRPGPRPVESQRPAESQPPVAAQPSSPTEGSAEPGDGSRRRRRRRRGRRPGWSESAAGTAPGAVAAQAAGDSVADVSFEGEAGLEYENDESADDLMDTASETAVEPAVAAGEDAPSAPQHESRAADIASLPPPASSSLSSQAPVTPEAEPVVTRAPEVPEVESPPTPTEPPVPDR